MKSFSLTISCCAWLALTLVGATCSTASATDLQTIVTDLAALGDRSTGSDGAAAAATYIENYFATRGLAPGIYKFPIPVREVGDSVLEVNGKTIALTPLLYNAITPQTVTEMEGAPLYYVKDGALEHLDGKLINGAILLMDFTSGRNWLTAASLGAQAVIYIDDGRTVAHSFFREKEELSPIQFPCFWMEKERADVLFGKLAEYQNGLVGDNATINSRITWRNHSAENIYTVIEGRDPELKDELIIIEAFYDSTRYVAGRSPGADEALSVANLLQLADHFTYNPPGRSIMLVATAGHAQSLHGMRDLIWSLQERSKLLRDQERELKKTIRQSKSGIALLDELSFPLQADMERDRQLATVIGNDLKFTIDQISRRLMNLRLQQSESADQNLIDTLAKRRFALRQLSWQSTFHDLDKQHQQLLVDLLPTVRRTMESRIADSSERLATLESARDFRALTREFDEIAATVSLHLSSHGDGVGGFNRGWLYQLRPRINRTAIFSTMAEVLQTAATAPVGTARYVDSLRPSRLRSWDSYFLDRPFLGGEVSSLAGYIGLTLATVDDGRTRWGTPWDTVEHVNWGYANDQQRLATDLISALTVAPALHNDTFPRNGYSSVTGNANLLLQGELFADYPAAGATLLSYQGIAKLYGSINSDGSFLYKGIADKKNVFDKLIIEGYRFDEQTGEVIWAIDKKETGKDNYRVKLQRRAMKTRLIMFNCRETTIFNLLEPRSLEFMTKLYLYDGRRDAPPQRYWYSRIDTRSSIISSIYLEPGAWLKLTLSDNVLTRKFILTNADEEFPMGRGFPVQSYPRIINTVHQAAFDAWRLLTPRIMNLESHGIHDDRIENLQERGLQALAASLRSLDELNYTDFRENSSEALALAARVYNQIEKTQKDVLFGVLFYIALFVPFAFCMERFLFGYANIYKRIVAFTAILVALIAIIYNVHPAFELAYSPMVVILAFFIIGLSFMVTLIIFFRFEQEMILLQRHASQLSAAEISRWKAFVAAFFLGVANLRRRRLRTILTCSTLVILTFTIMSFTTVKSSVQENRLFYSPDTPYRGLLLKKLNWRSMPPQATEILAGSMQDISNPAPRVWLEAAEPTRPLFIPLRRGSRTTSLQGIVGVSHVEAEVTGLDALLSSGRWFTRQDYQAIILSQSSAAQLGVTPGQSILLWGTPFTVIGIFDGDALDTQVDLDGEPLTPVTFPDDMSEELSDVEFEAMEEGDDIRGFQGRYTHIPGSLSGFIPAKTALAMGGSLKSVAIRPDPNTDVSAVASQLVDRFSLAIFAGTDDGVWIYNLSDTMGYSGVPNIIIPLLISILIVLNTMISSVYERKSEIGIYTSVGLAPSHVGFLFVAEAMALAVISVVVGYLVAQVSAAILADTSFWEGITVNYSSMAGVAAMILVMGVVLISVIYPARVAARIAIPDVKRTFNLPEPVNDTITVTLPFYMKYEERESIGGFLFQYFSSHQDISHGAFAADAVELIHACTSVEDIHNAVRDSQDPCAYQCIHLRSKIWLAPFDFGIMQRADIEFCPARDNLSYLEIRLSVRRESGEIGQWRRINTEFIHQLRKQLLIWRSMDNQTHQRFSSQFKVLTDSFAAV
jgi:cell division protein FtsX